MINDARHPATTSSSREASPRTPQVPGVRGRWRWNDLASAAVLTALLAAGCASGDKGPPAAAEPLNAADSTLVRAVGRAVAPCISTHRRAGASAYTAELRLSPDATAAAVADFVHPRQAGLETCVVDAINRARIPIAAAVVLPVAFDLGASAR